jgi:CubicO group peptidase (beta-lactamase class C family)
MLLNGGKLGNARILKPETVAQMTRNQIGDLTLVELRSQIPQVAKNPMRIPGALDKFGLGFGINTRPVDGGRSAGSLSWDGIFNTFFWIDPQRKTSAVILMQLLPFSDDEAISVAEKFEQAVYANAAQGAR